MIKVVGHQTDGHTCVNFADPPLKEMVTKDNECNRLADKSSRASPIDYIDMRIDLLQFDIWLCSRRLKALRTRVRTEGYVDRPSCSKAAQNCSY